ncbi:MAG: CBS domain-containing protein [Gemmatimonadetes bacterium]|nr:CBS domain-containing protein [Gemmatimonadota bacterium]
MSDTNEQKGTGQARSGLGAGSSSVAATADAARAGHTGGSRTGVPGTESGAREGTSSGQGSSPGSFYSNATRRINQRLQGASESQGGFGSQRGGGSWAAGQRSDRESGSDRERLQQGFGSPASREYESIQTPGERGWSGSGEPGLGSSGSRQPWPQTDRETGERDRAGRRGRWQREALTAREIMTTSIKAVTKQSTLKNVAQIMKDENVGVVPVVDDDHKLQGLVTDRDLVVRAVAGDKALTELKIEDIMTDDVEAVTPDESVTDVVELMGGKQIRRVPVVDRDDRLVGIISMGDIANRADYDEQLQEALEKISGKRSFWSRLT